MKKVLAFVAASTLMATSAMADEAVTSKFNMSIGGYVKLDYAYNSDNLGVAGTITPGGGGLSSALATNTGASQQEQSILGMKQSRLWVKVNGPDTMGAKSGALIEGDFYGDNSSAAESPQFRARLAYGTLDWANTQVLFGQYWDMFAPMVASTQDFRSGATTGAPNNPRSPQIRLTQKVNLGTDNKLSFAFAVTDQNLFGDNKGGAPNTLATASDAYGTNLAYAGQIFLTSKVLGVAPGYFGLSNQPLKVGVFGQYGNERLIGGAVADKLVDSWGYGAYLFAPILKSADGKGRAMTMSFEGQVYEASNMASNAATAAQFANGLTNATIGAATAALQNAATPRKDVGMAAQIIFYPTQELGITAGWGDRIAANKASDMGTTVYQKYNQELYLNVAYDLSSAVRVAVEYQNLEARFNNMNSSATTSAPGQSAVASVNIGRLCAYYFF